MKNVRRPEILVVIPARGGSKGIPGKNIKHIAGIPLIAYSIDAALHTFGSPRVVVSTDSNAIAKIARFHRAEIPFLRPAKLARDETPTLDVLIHLVTELERREGYNPDYLILLQPTSPLRSVVDIDTALSMIVGSKVDSLVSVTDTLESPYFMKTIVNGRIKSVIPGGGIMFTRRQDLPRTYLINGAIYISRVNALISKRRLYHDGSLAYVMPADRSIDIDELSDFMKAEEIILKRQGGRYVG